MRRRLCVRCGIERFSDGPNMSDLCVDCRACLTPKERTIWTGKPGRTRTGPTCLKTGCNVQPQTGLHCSDHKRSQTAARQRAARARAKEAA